MAGMEGLGRVFNYVPTASGNALSLRHYSSVTFLGFSAAAAATFTITTASSFGGTYATPGNIIVRYYRNTSQNGTAGWTKQTQTASNAVADTTLNATFAIWISGAMFPDPNCYIKCTATGAGALVAAVLHDPTYQRGPANLAIVGA